MVVLLFLFFGKKHQLFLVFALVGARLRDLFQTTPFRPFISEFIPPTRRQTAETELQERRTEDVLQTHEAFDLFLHVFGVQTLPVAWQQPIAMR